MAQIIIENAEVTSLIKGGIGFRAQTQYRTKDGEMIPEKWTVWTKDPVQVGDIVNIAGLFSKRDESFTNDKGEFIKYVGIHVNNPKVAKIQATQNAGDQWLQNNATEVKNDGQIPF
jgi:hypothetical protein